MIEIRILIAHTAPGLVNVARQVIEKDPTAVELTMRDFMDQGPDIMAEHAVETHPGLKVIRKDY